jgi:hypothetical protein
MISLWYHAAGEAPRASRSPRFPNGAARTGSGNGCAGNGRSRPIRRKWPRTGSIGRISRRFTRWRCLPIGPSPSNRATTHGRWGDESRQYARRAARGTDAVR